MIAQGKKHKQSERLLNFYETCEKFAQNVESKQQEIYNLLQPYETHATIQHELRTTLDALRGVSHEFAQIKSSHTDLTISIFLPLNLPLYSLVLYGVIQSAFAVHVYIRPPEVMGTLFHDIINLLDARSYFPQISAHSTPRSVFVDLYAKESDVVLFTGKYENAMSIHKECPQALIVYEGSGVCPFVICDNADLDLAVQKSVEMRCFNSGQDCVAPDVFFVPESLSDSFVSKLSARLDDLKIGNTNKPDTDIGKIIKFSYVESFKSWLETEKDNIVRKGAIHESEQIVEPSIIVKPATSHQGGFHEFFAPIFYILTYKNPSDLLPILESTAFKEHSMYASVFGSNTYIEKHMPLVTVLRNTIVNDIDRGNDPYGGYGDKANFILYGNKRMNKPILISNDIHHTLNYISG